MKVSIYQLSIESDKIFRPYDGKPLKLSDYKKVFTYEHKTNVRETEKVLNEIYNHLQFAAEGFNGHSLSVSDLIVLNGNIYYVDSYGYAKIDEVL